MNGKSLTKLVFVFVTSHSFAQNDNLGLAYYPLQAGDYWEYSETHYNNLLMEKRVNYSLEVIGDTVLTNNINYKIIQKVYIPDTLGSELVYERVDSTTGNVYRYSDRFNFMNDEYLIDSLNVQAGDTTKASRNDPWNVLNAATVCLDSTTVTLFNQNISVKDFANINYIPGFYYRLAKDIGLIRYYDSGEVISVDTELKYARIQDREYGDRITTEVRKQKRDAIENVLFQNYPNPFNSTTTISYSISEPATVELNIYNIKGQTIQTFHRVNENSGNHNLTFDASDMSSGIYVYELKTNGFATRKVLTLIK